jgi:hypothetical protein
LAVEEMMTYSRHNLRNPETDQMDRRMIRVEFPPAQAGIAAALRRSFRALPAEADTCAGDFAALLSTLS